MNYGIDNQDHLANFKDRTGGITPQMPQMGMPQMQQPPMTPPMGMQAPILRNPMPPQVNPMAPAVPPPGLPPQAPPPQQSNMLRNPLPPAPIGGQGMPPQGAPRMSMLRRDEQGNVMNAPADGRLLPSAAADNSGFGGKVAQVAEAMPQAMAEAGQEAPQAENKSFMGNVATAAQGIAGAPLEEAPVVSPYAQDRDSGSPEGQIRSIDAMAKASTADPEKIDPEIKKDIDEVHQQYGLGEVDDEQVFQCPYTNKPCSQKTFWQRLKEFFLHSIGMKSQEEIDAEITQLDHSDSIVQKYGKGTEGMKIPNPKGEQQQGEPQMAQSNDQFTPLPEAPMFQSPYGQQPQEPPKAYNPMAMEGGIA